MRIAVIGATGMLGKLVTRQLIDARLDVHIIARNIEKATQMFPGTKILKADLNDTESLYNALQGADSLYLSLNTLQNVTPNDWLPEREGVTNVIEAAKRADIKRIGLLSSIIKDYQGTDDFNWWVFGVKQRAEDLVKGSGIPYLIFYPSCFMECFTGPYKMGRIITLAGHTDIAKYWITGSDYGKQVAQAFKTVPENESREYVIQGPDAYTDEEAADIFIKNYPHKLFKIKSPEILLKMGGWFSKKFNYGYHILHAMNNYPEKFEAQKTWEDLGKPKTTLAEFAKDYDNM